MYKKLSRQHTVLGLGRNDFGEDFSRLSEILPKVKSFTPNVLINATAFTAVDNAESNVEKAYLLNCHIPKILAVLAKQWGALFIHFSTDYVLTVSKPVPTMNFMPPCAQYLWSK